MRSSLRFTKLGCAEKLIKHRAQARLLQRVGVFPARKSLNPEVFQGRKNDHVGPVFLFSDSGCHQIIQHKTQGTLYQADVEKSVLQGREGKVSL